MPRSRARRQSGDAPSKLCFVISQIGSKGTPERKRSDQILEHVIRPVLEECGYAVQRADEIEDPGTITNQVIERLIRDDLVVADLTGPNANVFYELAVRHAARKPAIHLIEEGQVIPFDIRASRTIVVNHHDLDSVRDCKLSLAAQVHAIEKDPNQADNPISNAIRFDFQLRELESRTGSPDRRMDAILSLLLEIQQTTRQAAVRRDYSTREVTPDDPVPVGVVAMNWGDRIVSYDDLNLTPVQRDILRGYLSERRRHGWKPRNIREQSHEKTPDSAGTLSESEGRAP